MQHRHVVAAGLVEILPGIVCMDAWLCDVWNLAL